MFAGTVAFVVMMFAWNVATGTSSRYYHGGSVLYAVLACVVIAGALQPGALRTALGFAPLAWIGRLSYGLYLFHWPMIVWLVPTRVHLHGLELNALRLVLTFVAATLSFYLIELPIRERRRPSRAPWKRARALRPFEVAAIATQRRPWFGAAARRRHDRDRVRVGVDRRGRAGTELPRHRPEFDDAAGRTSSGARRSATTAARPVPDETRRSQGREAPSRWPDPASAAPARGTQHPAARRLDRVQPLSGHEGRRRRGWASPSRRPQSSDAASRAARSRRHAASRSRHTPSGARIMVEGRAGPRGREDASRRRGLDEPLGEVRHDRQRQDARVGHAGRRRRDAAAHGRRRLPASPSTAPRSCSSPVAAAGAQRRARARTTPTMPSTTPSYARLDSHRPAVRGTPPRHRSRSSTSRTRSVPTARRARRRSTGSGMRPDGRHFTPAAAAMEARWLLPRVVSTTNSH